MRSNFTQLPSVAETDEILAREAKRPVPLSKFDKHYPDFSTVIEWLRLVGLPTHVFEDEVSWQEAMGTGGQLQDELVKRTLILPDFNLHKKINNYLGEKEAPQKADIILVFGSHDIRRVEVAVDYWKQGLAPLLVMTGGSPHYGSRELPEAETFKQEAVRMGVPENAIITEPNSITIPDNVRSTLNLLDERLIKYDKVIAVVSWFAMRRVWVHLQKYGNGSIRIYRSCPKPHNPLLKPDEWFLHDEGIKVIFNEFVKMRVAQMMNTA